MSAKRAPGRPLTPGNEPGSDGNAKLSIRLTPAQCAHCNAHVASNAVIVRGGEQCCKKCAAGIRAHSKLHGVR